MVMLRNLKQERQSAKLQYILLSTYVLNATDPRDKIFALLGIAMDVELLC
jgi:hypothetical protein